MSLSRQSPHDGPARDPAVDLHRRARRARSTSSGAPSQKRIVFQRRRHLHVLVERPARVARPVPDPRAAHHARSSSSRRSSAGAEGRLLGVHPRRRRHPRRGGPAPAPRTKAEETIYDLFLWPEGQFEFKDGELPATTSSTIDLDVTAVILEGVRRVDEWKRIRKVFPSPGHHVHAAARRARGDDGSRPSDGSWSWPAPARPWPRSSLELRRSRVRDGGARSSTCTGAGCSRWSAPRAAAESDHDPWAPSRTCSPIADAASRGAPLRRARSQAYEEVLTLDRLNQNAKKGLMAVIEARDRERAVKQGAARQGAAS